MRSEDYVMTASERKKKMQRLGGVLALLSLLSVALQWWKQWLLFTFVSVLILVFAGMLAHLWWEEWQSK